MGIRRKFFAATYDFQIRNAERGGLTEMRRSLLAQASGRVLEVGGGTGANLAHYGSGRHLADGHRAGRVDDQTPRTSCSRRSTHTTVLRAPAEDLPFEDGTFDVVVSTLVLCGVDDQPRAVREIRRVLHPQGRLLFLEHLRSSDAKVAKAQDRLNWLNRLVVCCDCNRPTLDTIIDAGFEITLIEHTSLPKAPPFVRPTIVGTATAPKGKNHIAQGQNRLATPAVELGANR